jgi:hypothetical protein
MDLESPHQSEEKKALMPQFLGMFIFFEYYKCLKLAYIHRPSDGIMLRLLTELCTTYQHAATVLSAVGNEYVNNVGLL